MTSKRLWYSSDFLDGGFDSVILQQFTADGIKALSLKKRYGFLHVTEEILEVFDEFHVSPFLDLLMGCVVYILESCTNNTLDTKSHGSSLTDSGCNSFDEHDGGLETEIMVMLCLLRPPSISKNRGIMFPYVILYTSNNIKAEDNNIMCLELVVILMGSWFIYFLAS